MHTRMSAPAHSAEGDVREAPMIELAGVNKWFGKLHVLREVTLSIGHGEVVVVIRPLRIGKVDIVSGDQSTGGDRLR
jgi:ABC-type transporter Mla maintaining outer membrane lipid asymmetry ATPase subunit MlaF